MRHRGFNTWGLQTGPFAACWADFVPKFCSSFLFSYWESNYLIPQRGGGSGFIFIDGTRTIFFHRLVAFLYAVRGCPVPVVVGRVDVQKRRRSRDAIDFHRNKRSRNTGPVIKVQRISHMSVEVHIFNCFA